MRQRVPETGIGSEFGLSRSGGYQFSWRDRTQLYRTERTSATANGRAALGLAAKYAKCKGESQRNTILLPAYLCHSMIQPFLEAGLRVSFYPVANDLSINLAGVRNRIDDSILAVVLVHYFGFQQPDDLAFSLKKQFPQVTVIDDRTHILLSDLHAGKTPGEHAIIVYSPRKWGPFPDLGLVVWPRLGDQAQENDCFDKGYDLSFGAPRILGILLRTLFFAWPVEVLGHLSLALMRRGEATLDRRIQVRRASHISLLLWRFWDWAAAWHARRENYQYLLDNWPSSETEPLFRNLPQTVCPLGFPIRSANRDELRAYLISKGIYPPIHWLRPSQVSPDEFPEAAALAKQELTVPIDQRYELRHMNYILEVISHA
jgi:hypothetical protein